MDKKIYPHHLKTIEEVIIDLAHALDNSEDVDKALEYLWVAERNLSERVIYDIEGIDLNQ